MANDWEIVKIEDIADVKSGKRLPYGHSLVGSETPFPYIRLVDISEGKIRRDNLQYLTGSTREKIKKYVVNTSDVCLAIVGHTIGMVFYVSPEWDNNNLTENAARITNIKENIISKYLYYFLISPNGQSAIFSRKVGSAQGKLPLYNIKSLEVLLPPIAEQKSIAHILGSLDDKIELNRQMNETLEAMAQALFKSWFVDFDPVIDNALAAGKPIPDELSERAEQRKAVQHGDNQAVRALFPDEFELTEQMGWIPKGWDVDKLGKYVEVKRGGSPRPIHDYLASEGLPWVKISDATASNSRFLASTKQFIKTEGLNKTTLLKKGTLILSNSATPGVPKFLDLDACIHDGWLHFPNKNIFTDNYLYQLFLLIRNELLMQGNGSVFTNLKTDILKNHVLVVPTIKILERFEKSIKLIHDKINYIQLENNYLIKIRDTLLPKLLSGELRIPDAAALVEDI